MAAIPPVTDTNFDTDVLRSPLPVMVDFSATWCGPCKALAPTVERVARQYDGRARVYGLDVDESGDVAARYGIMSVPTVLFFKGGQVVDKVIGLVGEEDLRSRLDRLLG